MKLVGRQPRGARWGVVLALLLGAGAMPLAVAAPRPEAMVNDLYESASHAFEEGDFARALGDLGQAIAKQPTSRAHLLRANVYVKLGQIEEARADYERVLQLEKNPKLRASVQKLKQGLELLPKARLAITSQPPGATIYVDLKAEGAKGKTPQVVPVAPGRHRIMLELDGHETFVQRDVVAVANQEVAVAATLLVRGCDLQLTTSPAGAQVKLDGLDLGASPIDKRIAGGEHALVLSRAGHQDVRRSVICQPGTPITLAETLPRLPEASLELPVPNGATLLVDGKDPKGVSPYALPPGEHQLELTSEGQAPWRASVQLAAGQSLRLQPTLVALPKAGAQPSVARSWWLWTTVGLVVAGVAVGVGLAIGLRRETQFDIVRVFEK